MAKVYALQGLTSDFDLERLVRLKGVKLHGITLNNKLQPCACLERGNDLVIGIGGGLLVAATATATTAAAAVVLALASKSS